MEEKTLGAGKLKLRSLRAQNTIFNSTTQKPFFRLPRTMHTDKLEPLPGGEPIGSLPVTNAGKLNEDFLFNYTVKDSFEQRTSNQHSPCGVGK